MITHSQTGSERERAHSDCHGIGQISIQFGGQQQQAESKLGQATGLGSNAGQLLAMLAPLVMSFLAKRVQAQGMGANDLGNALGQERSQIQAQGGMAGGILGSLLDQNGDGKLDAGDLLKLGAGLLGGKR